MVAALADSDHLYTQRQLAWMIEFDRGCRDDDPEEPGFRELLWRSAFEAGYQARVAEENAAYRQGIADNEADSGLRSFTQKVDARRQADFDGGADRPGDFPGGRETVRPWPADQPDPRFDRRPPWERY